MTYFGGKGGEGVYQTLINEIPPHLVYVEGCLGGGAIMRHKLPAAVSVGIDLDGIALGEFGREFGVLPGLSLVNACCLDWLAEHFADRDVLVLGGQRVPAGLVFVYLDPPYPHHTRKSDKRYRVDADAAFHSRMLGLVTALRCRVMVSSYPNAGYRRTLQRWRTFTFEARTRRGWATEQIWMNYPAGPLHDCRFLGGNKRQREVVRRRRRNWSRGLSRMPLAERLAVFADLVEGMRGEVDFESAEAMLRTLGGKAVPPAGPQDAAAVPGPKSKGKRSPAGVAEKGVRRGSR